MTRKSSLSTALNKAAGKVEPSTIAQRAEHTKKVVESLEGKTYIKPVSRQGKKAVGGHFDPEIAKQLKQLAIESERSVQDLLSEAIGDLFEKHGKPRLF